MLATCDVIVNTLIVTSEMRKMLFQCAAVFWSGALLAGCDHRADPSVEVQRQLAQALAATPTPGPEMGHEPEAQPGFESGPGPAAKKWYAADVNKTTCVDGPSPADRIREIQNHGDVATTTDLSNGGVEVGSDEPDGKFRYWTIFRSQQACIDALPRSQPIPGRYE